MKALFRTQKPRNFTELRAVAKPATGLINRPVKHQIANRLPF